MALLHMTAVYAYMLYYVRYMNLIKFKSGNFGSRHLV